MDKAVRQMAPTLRLSHTEQQEVLSHATLTRYGADEAIQVAGEVPPRMSFIVSGRVSLTVLGKDGAVIPVRTLTDGDFLGQTTLTREGALASAHAVQETTVLQVERHFLEELVLRNPLLLHELGRMIEERRTAAQQALTASAK